MVDLKFLYDLFNTAGCCLHKILYNLYGTMILISFKLLPKNTPWCHEVSLLLRKNINLDCDSLKPTIFYPELSRVITDENSCVSNNQDNI